MSTSSSGTTADTGRGERDGVPLLEVAGIGKRFPGVIALDNVGFTVQPGEIVGLIGENGAGKSTLMKVLGGVHQPDSGTIKMDGVPVTIRSVSDSLALGISFIHQELNVLDNIDIAGNVFLGREPRTGPLRLMDRATMYREADVLLRRVGLAVPSQTPLSELSLAQQQMVEIAKALSLKARLLIMDEPTSSLTLTETERLLDVAKELRAQGVSIIYISHRLHEITAIADRVVGLRDGRSVGSLSKDEITHDRMVSLMVGRDLERFYAAPDTEIKPVGLVVKELRSARYPTKPVSFDVRKGEILGMAGLVGAGRSELARTVFGVDRAAGGSLTFEDKPLVIHSPRDAIDYGIFLAPEDRRATGLIMDMLIRENITLPALKRYAPGGLIQRSLEDEVSKTYAKRLNVKAPSIEVAVSTLSGGNQQKVVLAKWLSLGPKVLIFDEPTRGIDVGAKAEIYHLMRSLAAEGVAIWMISSDMEEVLGVSDRVAVMHEGSITGILDRADCSEEAVMALAVGGEKVGNVGSDNPSVSAATDLPAGSRGFRFPKVGKEIGILLLLLVLCVAVTAKNPLFLSVTNLANMSQLIGMYGIFSIGMGIVIITSGIDLSVGSMFALLGVLLAMMLSEWHWPWPLAVAATLAGGAVLGVIHGLLITRLNLQPFIVTLCGLLFYRGLARFIAHDETKGFGDAHGFEFLQKMATGSVHGVPIPFILLLIIAAIMWVALHRSVWGRYLYAVGRNEDAARYSGINARGIITGAYVLSGVFAGITSILLAFYTNSISPSSHGNSYELYGVAAAVLGGCSLRGGEGSIIGIIIGTILLQVLQNLVNLLGIDSSLNFAVMGAVILLGVIADQLYQGRKATSH